MGNRTKVEYTEKVWNPITGCMNKCSYCYAPGMCSRFSGDIRANKAAGGYEKDGDMYILKEAMLDENGKKINYPFGFEPTYHPYRKDVLESYKTGTNILVASMGEMFGPWVSDDIILEVFEMCREFPQHNYMFMTKHPERLYDLAEKGMLPKDSNFWYGTSCTGNCKDAFRSNAYNCYIAFEPLLEDPEITAVQLNGIKWVIIGAQTRKQTVRKTTGILEEDWVDRINKECDLKGIPVFHRRTMVDYVETVRHEYPAEMTVEKLSERREELQTANCCMCGTKGRKNKMAQIFAKTERKAFPKLVTYMCDHCYTEFLSQVMGGENDGL